MRRSEGVAFLGGLAAACACLALFGGRVLWTRPLWMDEVCTAMLTRMSSPSHMLVAIKNGGDWQPPLWHLTLWFLMRLVGVRELTPTFLHTVSAICVSVALLVVYAALRRRFGRMESLAGVLACAANAIVVEHAFEGRFYGPWLLLAAAYAWSLGVEAERAASRRRDVVQGAFAILLVTIHWYAMFSLGLMVAGVLAAGGRQWRTRLRLLAPSLAGVIVCVALLPLALAQRAVAAPLFWIKPLDDAQLASMLTFYFPVAVMLLVAMTLAASWALRRYAPRWTQPDPGRGLDDPTLAALLSLALMPVVLVVVSVVLQPAMIPRYAIVTALALPPVVAYATRALRGVLQLGVVAVLGVILVGNVAKHVRAQRDYAQRVSVDRAALMMAMSYDAPAVFTAQHMIHPAAGARSAMRASARYLDMPDSTIDRLYPAGANGLKRNVRLDRDQARFFGRVLGFPGVISLVELRTLPRFLLVDSDLSLPYGFTSVDEYAKALFPLHRVVRLSPNLTLFTRGPSPRGTT